MVAVSLSSIALFYRTHKCPEFAGDNPVKVTVFNSLVELVFFNLELFEIIPAHLDGELQALQTLEQSAVVQTVSLARISEVLEQVAVLRKLAMSFFCTHFEYDNAEATHEEGRVDHLVRLLTGAVVEHLALAVVLVSQQPG